MDGFVGEKVPVVGENGRIAHDETEEAVVGPFVREVVEVVVWEVHVGDVHVVEGSIEEEMVEEDVTRRDLALI